jgi:hypothetical protein
MRLSMPLTQAYGRYWRRSGAVAYAALCSPFSGGEIAAGALSANKADAQF